MKKSLLLIFIASIIFSCKQSEPKSDLEAKAERVEIIRDDFGVPHIYGKPMQMWFSDYSMRNARMISEG
jgi:acyl-homoserine lactone acylase PvdQ